jgi:glycine reductase
VTAVTPVAKMVGANRVVQGRGIVYPLGDAALDADEEKDLRRSIVRQALEALKTEV